MNQFPQHTATSGDESVLPSLIRLRLLVIEAHRAQQLLTGRQRPRILHGQQAGGRGGDGSMGQRRHVAGGVSGAPRQQRLQHRGAVHQRQRVRCAVAWVADGRPQAARAVQSFDHRCDVLQLEKSPGYLRPTLRSEGWKGGLIVFELEVTPLRSLFHNGGRLPHLVHQVGHKRIVQINRGLAMLRRLRQSSLYLGQRRQVGHCQALLEPCQQLQGAQTR
mmetsp:Transcript_18627/g.56240  ORF Transcript_18627/g.56240 Transcript_18627/m.56240 type:complete len:219 (+) Transcript_18627:3147-3803(+)